MVQGCIGNGCISSQAPPQSKSAFCAALKRAKIIQIRIKRIDQQITMKILANSGNERVIDVLKASLQRGCSVDLATNDVSIFAFGELQRTLELCTHVNLGSVFEVY